jgi:quinol monooxygenase YgiN
VAIVKIVVLSFDEADAEEAFTHLGLTLPQAREFDGCLGVEALQDEAEPGRVVLVERWESRDHDRRSSEWRRGDDTAAGLVALLQGPPQITFYAERPEV